MLGRIKWVPNEAPRHHAEAGGYVYIKVQQEFGLEEHLLLTEAEFATAAAQFKRLYAGTKLGRPGYVALVPCGPRPQDTPWYVLTATYSDGEERGEIGLAFATLERIRQRVERHRSLVVENRPGWWADLFD